MAKEIKFNEGLRDLQIKLEQKKLENELNFILKTAQFIMNSLETIAPNLKTLGIKSILFNNDGKIVVTVLEDGTIEDNFKVLHKDIIYTIK